MNKSLPLTHAGLAAPAKTLARLALVGLLMHVPPSRAATISKANNDDALNLGTSWVGGAVPTANDIAQFNNTLTVPRSPNLGVNTNWLGLKLTNPGGTVSIGNSPATTLTLLGSGIDMSSATGNLTLQCGVNVSGGQTWNIASGRTLDASTVALGRYLRGTVDFSTNGTIKIGNVLANGIVGAWATCGGDDWATGASGGAVSGLPAASYTPDLVSGNNSSTNSNPNIIPGSFTTGTLKLTTNFDWTANAGDVVTLDRSGILVPSGVSNYLSAASGIVTLRGSAGGELLFQGGGTLQLASSAVIANNTSATGLTKSGNGTLILNGADTFTGTVTLNSGTLVIGNNNALGTSAASFFYINGGALDCIGNRFPLQGGPTTHDSYNGDFTFLGGDNGNRTFTLPYHLVNLTRDIRITVVSGTLITPKQMYDAPGGHYGFTKDGAGTLQMNRLNDISGVVHMVAGALFFNNSTGEGTGTKIGYNLVGATLDMQGGSLIFTSAATNHCINGLLGSGTIDFGQSAGNFALSITGIGQTYSGSMTGPNGGIMITSPAFYDGSGNLVSGGSAIQTLSGPNTYGGNTLICLDNAWGGVATNCTLALSGSGSVSNSASIIVGFIGEENPNFYTYQTQPDYATVGVNPFGAVFDVSGVTGGSYTLDGSVAQSLVGNGTVKGKLIVPSGSSVAPGLVNFLYPDGMGALTFTVAPTMASGSTMAMKIKKIGATLTSDKITVTGGALVYGGTLSVNLDPTSDGLAAGDQFTLFSAGSYSGTFATLNLPDVSAAGLQWNTSLLSFNGSIKVENAGTVDPVTSLIVNKIGGNYNFNYAGGSGSQFVLVRSFNLIPPVTWTPLLTNTTTPGLFSIPIGPNPAAFYRVKSQ